VQIRRNARILAATAKNDFNLLVLTTDFDLNG
jgi:hypothetical protein